MQEQVAASAAQNEATDWYLTRDGKQYGPLTDRELSLFAEGGNFRSGDLLWREGLETWKPADALLSLAPEAADDDPDMNALVRALTAAAEPPQAKPTLKSRLIEEIKKFAAIFLYLWIVFMVLLLHEWIVLAEKHISFTFYGLAAINALVLGKIMLIADNLRFAERLKHMPLVYPIVFKSVAFTTLLLIAYVLEEMLIGWFKGNGFVASVPPIGGGTATGVLSVWLIFCIALLPFFAFKEIGRAIGRDAFRALLFGQKPSDAEAASGANGRAGH